MASREALVIGALLHDIGKFEFRTADRRQAHTTYGDFFVGEYLGQFQCLRPLLEEIRLLVAHHHDPEAGDPFLRQADHLAASERQVDESSQTLRSLVSVLGAVDIGRGAVPGEVYRYIPKAVDFADPFPERLAGVEAGHWVPDREESLDEHKEAWDAFCEEMHHLPDRDSQSWTETFLALTKKYLSRVTSAAYKSHPDISLYDHARSVAAIAVCLQEAGLDATEPFALIQGDISGIQKFMYRLAAPEEPGSTKRMAKRLRGRSLYLALLSETVARCYLRDLDLPPTNLLYCGGGHFLILAPNTGAAETKWKQTEEEINRWLLKEQRGELALVSAATPASKELLQDFPKLMRQSGEALNLAKRQKFGSVLDEALFEPHAFDEQMDVCPVCQVDCTKEEIRQKRTCHECQEHVERGQKMVQAQYVVRVEMEAREGADGFRELGFDWHLAEDWSAAAQWVERLKGVSQIHVERLNNSDFLSQEKKALAQRLEFPLSLGFRAVGQYAPKDEKDGGPLEFEELAALNSKQYPLLGIVRADVDSLGAVFATGLGKKRSLSRAATLSRELETFFCGYVNKLAEEHGMYITYAGGDDLFAVGSWINALTFGQKLREHFGRFACGNPNLTLSGGILFCKPDFPIGRAAEVAGELEHKAKNNRDNQNNKTKDSVALFGEVVTWERLKNLMEYGDILLDLVTEKSEGNHLPRSFVHRLLALGSRIKDTRNVRAEMEARMRLKYLVARRGATSRAISGDLEMEKEKRKIGALGRLVTELDLMQHIAIPASYVLYRTRNLNEESGENRHE